MRFSKLGADEEAEARLVQTLNSLRANDPQRATITAALERCRRLHDLEQRLPALLGSQAKPTTLVEGLDLAWLCQQPRQGHYAASVRFYQGAFAAKPRLQEDLTAGYRYQAACAAALAGAPPASDSRALNEPSKAAFRQQALAWLRAELAARSGQLAASGGQQRDAARIALQHWKHDAALAGVRNAPRLAQLEPAEREEWERLWADVNSRLCLSEGGKSAP